MSKKNETPLLDGLQAEIQNLREAKALLEDLWHAYPSYGNQIPLTTEMRLKLDRYFDFDNDE